MAREITGLRQVTLENFQVFGDEVQIPMGRIVMLFGPNSAGKSAVLDGIKVMSDMLGAFAYANGRHLGSKVKLIEESAWMEGIRRHMRRTTQNSSGDALKTRIAIELSAFEWTVATRVNGHPRLPANHNNRVLDIGIELVIAGTSDERRRPFLPYELSITVGGKKLLGINERDHISFNPFHPAIDFTPHAFKTEHQQAFLKLQQDRLKIEDGLFRWRLEPYVSDWILEIGMIKDAFDDDAHQSEVPGGTDSLAYRTLAGLAFEEFAESFNLVLGSLCAEAHDLCVSGLVEASRRIPTPEELCYQFSYIAPILGGGTAGGIVVPGLPVTGLPEFSALARELFIDWWDQSLGLGRHDTRQIPAWAAESRSASLSIAVNRALSDSFFVDRLYQCCVDVRVLVDAKDVRELLNDSKYDPKRIAASDCLVQLKLLDAEGRSLDFVDVGSGLGYLLPVLVHLFARGPVPLVFVQQPELHLHPALQAALGDVILDATRSGRSAVIETHSEHILLRLLRRVKQSSAPQSRVPTELSLDAEDLVIIYFDPQRDGQTKVRRLRVSRDGDFLDRWPRGFFDEREKELFDDED